MAERRIAFYLRAGACATRIESRVFGVRYNILTLPCGGHETDAVVSRELKDLYRMMVPRTLLSRQRDILRPLRVYYPREGA